MRRKRLVIAAAGALLLAVIVWLAMPAAVPVEVAEVVRGPLQVTVDEEGHTRVQERYVVAAPVAGQLQRVLLEAGDVVEAGQLLFTFLPAPTTPLDARTAAEVRQRLRAAQASMQSAEAAAELARSDLERQRQLLARGALAAREIDAAESRAESSAQRVREARALAEALRAQLGRSGTTEGAPVVQRAPAAGVVLRVQQESQAVVAAGTPVLEIGDPSRIEVVTDLLSEEAVRVMPGAEVILERWGGERPLRGRVQRVEPGGYTKVSALGVEEQRVDVIIDLVDRPGARGQLGDGYRVVSRIVTFSADDVVTVPLGALFRTGRSWSVFRVEDGRARLREVRVGPRSNEAAQILGGVEPGDRVVLYPGDRIEDGTRVEDASR